MMTVIHDTYCPRCQGLLVIEADDLDTYLKCTACGRILGYLNDREEPPPLGRFGNLEGRSLKKVKDR